tara:strand:- start:345 stop:515 length:171 start_codon:yes stop_codon:yes gene_type:complete
VTPKNIRITETNFTGNVFIVNGSSKNLKIPILTIPEISKAKMDEEKPNSFERLTSK